MSEAQSPPRLVNIANILTMFRIVLVPVVLVLILLLEPEPGGQSWIRWEIERSKSVV